MEKSSIRKINILYADALKEEAILITEPNKGFRNLINIKEGKIIILAKMPSSEVALNFVTKDIPVFVERLL